MNFGNKLRYLIEERYLTQKKVANDLHIPPSTLGGYVQGVNEPDFDTLKKLAHYFDVTTDYLLDYNSSNCENTFENELLRVFRSMSTEHQKIYIEQGKAFIKTNKI